MPKRRRTWVDRLMPALIGAAVVIVVVMSIAGSIASSMVSANHPVLRAAVMWAVLGGFAAGAFYLWRVWRTRRRTRHRELIELLGLTPTEFEEAVGDLLRDSGFKRVQRVGASGDLCADLKAVDPQGRDVVVQCKRLAPGTKIGSPDIQKFIGMTVVHHRASRGIFVTTSAFTGPATELAKKHSLDLWDGAYLSSKLGDSRARRSRVLPAMPH